MTRRRTHLFATAALIVATAFAASTALAIAESKDSMTWQRDSSTDARYSSNQGPSAPDQAVDSQPLNPSSSTDEDSMNSPDSSSDTGQDMDSNEGSASDDPSTSSDNMSAPDEDSSRASSAGISSTQASTAMLGSRGYPVAEAPSEDATAVSGSTLVTRTRPVYVVPPDQPRYTPETGDAQYGSKLDPTGPASNRFNDATGQ